jgi:hypothetical protein
MTGEAGIIRHRLAILRAGGIVPGAGASGAGEGGQGKRDRSSGGHGFSS